MLNDIKNKYVECFEKNCLIIYYDIYKWQALNEKQNEEEEDEEEEDDEEEEEENNEEDDDDNNNNKIHIFGNDFVTNNRNKLFLIVNNKKSKLKSKIKVDENYLEVILVQNSNNYNKDLICMFEKCKYLMGFNLFKIISINFLKLS